MMENTGEALGEARLSSTVAKSQLHSSSDSRQMLRCEANRKKSEFKCNRLVSTINMHVDGQMQ